MVSQSVFVAAAVAAAVGMLVGGLIGHFGTPTPTQEEKDMVSSMRRLVKDGWTQDANLNQRIIDLVDRDNLKENLRILSEQPHLAATERDNFLAKMVRDRFKESGFDTSELVPYNLLLSRPLPEDPNKITLINGTDQVVFESHHKEKALHEDDDDPNFVHAFNAFTPAGDVRTEAGGGVVYINYGRVEDFDKLTELGVDVTGHILIARYGKIFRGNKLMHAQDRGAKGLILFSDPKDVALDGVEAADVYPETWWLPGSGMQRGGTYMGEGDPLTPGWPSTANAYRLEIDEALLPTIPCQPIGYDDARRILEIMADGGIPTPTEWVGGLEGIPYHLGPTFLPEYSSYSLRLRTNNVNKVYNNYNVIGTIKGDVEPDRYVLIGNHRDAWGYGASDASSGTAQLLETARVLGVLLKEGWRPRRTLVFCSWGAEEYGIIGSTEWVEEHIVKLQERAVMYLNTDTCASGPILHAPGSPLMWGPITEITKMVPGVASGSTLYEEWKDYHVIKSNTTTPKMATLGSGSDYAPFSFYLGIPALDIWFRRDQNKHDISIYPSYHTGYETFYMVSTHVDPAFRIHQGCSRISALILRLFSDSALLPYSLNDLPKAMKDAFTALKEANNNAATLLGIYDKFPLLEESLDNWIEATSVFQREMMERKDNLDPVSLRSLNDQLMKMEQAFTIPEGLPGRPDTRHAVFAPSQFDSYAASGFPGLSDLLYGLDALQGENRTKREKAIKRHISDLTILVQGAQSLTEEFEFI